MFPLAGRFTEIPRSADNRGSTVYCTAVYCSNNKDEQHVFNQTSLTLTLRPLNSFALSPKQEDHNDNIKSTFSKIL